jgi:hypothetical protein
VAGVSAGFDPRDSVRPELLFPDRDTGLDGLDSGPAGRESLVPVGCGGGHGDRNVPDGEAADPVTKGHPGAGCSLPISTAMRSNSFSAIGL